MYCGGFGVQWAQNQGKCGVCGDDYRDEVPRQHETGGKFGNEIITATYTAGDTLDIEVEIVANHWGFFVLKVCPMTEPGEIASQACLDQHPLEVVKTGDRREVTRITCEAVIGRSVAGMNTWCEDICRADPYHCPTDICNCTAHFKQDHQTTTEIQQTTTTTTTTTTATTTTTTVLATTTSTKEPQYNWVVTSS